MCTGEIVVVLQADMVSSTALRCELGDDRMDVVQEALLGRISEVVADSGGQVLKDLGDGLSCCFATASAALEAAAAIHRQLELLAADFAAAVPLRVRIGFAFGDIVRTPNDVRGRAPIEAARI